MEPIINESRQVYIERINAVQDYIENHLDEEITIRKLCKIASFSEYHFQRIFKQFTSESLYNFIKRLRLEKAIFLLRSNRKLSIQDIALSVGFSNQASFAKNVSSMLLSFTEIIPKQAKWSLRKINLSIFFLMPQSAP